MEEFNDLDGLLSSIFTNNGLGPIRELNQDQRHEDNGLASSRELVSVNFQAGAKLNLFLKIKRSGTIVEKFEEKLHIYQREVLMYTDIIPMLAKYQEENGKDVQHSIKELFPKYYGAGVIKKDLFLVFEDIITDTEMFVTGKGQFHTNEQVNMCLTQLGAFHALSYGYKTKHQFSFLETYPILQDILFLPENKEFLGANFDMIGAFTKQLSLLDAVRIEVLEKNPLLSSTIQRACSKEDITRLVYASKHLYEFFNKKMFPPVDPSAVVTHGDFHMWNVAFGSKDSVKFFDLQVSRYTSCMTDVQQYLSQTTTPETRKIHLEEFLTSYLHGFGQSCKELGIKETILTKEGIADEYKRLAPWGLLMGIDWILYRFVTDQESFTEVEKQLGIEPSARNTKKVVEYLDKSGPKIWWAIQVLFDLIFEANEMGTIGELESFKE